MSERAGLDQRAGTLRQLHALKPYQAVSSTVEPLEARLGPTAMPPKTARPSSVIVEASGLSGSGARASTPPMERACSTRSATRRDADRDAAVERVHRQVDVGGERRLGQVELDAAVPGEDRSSLKAFAWLFRSMPS